MADSLEITAQVKEIIGRSNLQTRSLAGLPDGFLDPFIEKKKELLLIFKGQPRKGKLLNRIDDENFEVDVPDLIPYLKNGSALLVVMPGAGSRYVIQARVGAVYPDRVRLLCMDPRFSARIVPEGELVVSWRRVPDEVELAVREGGLRLFRNSEKGIIEKVSVDDDKRNPPGFEGKRRFAVMGDISSGGCRLVSKASIPPEMVNHLVYIENEDSAPFRLGVFGVVRSVRAEGGGGQAHVMFVARLPDRAAEKAAGK